MNEIIYKMRSAFSLLIFDITQHFLLKKKTKKNKQMNSWIFDYFTRLFINLIHLCTQLNFVIFLQWCRSSVKLLFIQQTFWVRLFGKNDYGTKQTNSPVDWLLAFSGIFLWIYCMFIWTNKFINCFDYLANLVKSFFPRHLIFPYVEN